MEPDQIGWNTGSSITIERDGKGDPTGRLICPYCEVAIGQTGDSAGEAPVIAPLHDAPCGLRCVGSKRRHWHTHGERMHTGYATCSVCKPKPCPVCGGSKNMIVSLTEARKMGVAHVELGRALHAAVKDPDGFTFPIKCTRCNGSGMVRGPL